MNTKTIPLRATIGANSLRTAAMREWIAWITRPIDVIRKHHREFVYGPVDDAVDAIIRELAPRLVKEIGEREIDEDVEEYIEGARKGRFEALADMYPDPERGKSDDYNAGYEWGFENAREWNGRELPSRVKRKVVRDQIQEFRGEITEQVVIDLMEKAWHVVSPAHTFKAIVQAVKKHGWKLGIGFALFEIFEHAVLPTVMIKLTGDPRMAVLGTIPIGEIIYAVGLRILGTPKDVDKFQEDGYFDWYEAKYGPVRLASLTRVVSTHRRKTADLSPPLGFPGGPCHLMERVHQEVGNHRLRDRIVDSIEEGSDISNADASKVYSVEKERGVGGKFLSQIEITAHAQYRMDQRGITVPEVRLALKQFRKAFYDGKSQGSPLYQQWSSDMAWGSPIQWGSPMGLTVVFDGSQNKAALITAYWTGQSNPRPKDEEECGFASAGRVAAGLGDCYEANGRYFMKEALFDGDSGLRLVHGEVTGQGPLEGVNYGHAWIEDGNTVLDMSNGRKTRMPKALYYALGNIEGNDNIYRYSASEFRRKISKYEHWGPWDLRTSTGF